MKIVEFAQDDLSRYMEISIGFWVKEQFKVTQGELKDAVPVEPAWWKDYDRIDEDRPDRKPSQFDTSNWAFLGLEEDGEFAAAATLARDTLKFNLLEFRKDLVHVIDFRVAERFRGRGYGRQLWKAAEAWAITQGAIEIRVETQDVNVPACRFYQAMGCRLYSMNASAYGDESDEVQLIWGRRLPPQENF